MARAAYRAPRCQMGGGAPSRAACLVADSRCTSARPPSEAEAKPGGSSPFLMGDWPWYIIGFEVVGLLFFWVISLPMAWSGRRAGREAEA